MTKEITKAIILQELEDKLKLREFTPANFLFEETVIPTYDIHPHLQKRVIKYTEISITSGPAGHVFFMVPDNEKWYLNRYNIVFMGAGAYTVTGVYYYQMSTPTKMMYIDMTAGQTVSYAKDLPKPVILEPTDRLAVYVDSYTSTQNLRLYIDYVREEVR